MSDEKEIKISLISTETLERVKEYLSTKPFGEVAHLIAALVSESQTFKPEMLKAIEPNEDVQNA